jgi:hypothetical protein
MTSPTAVNAVANIRLDTYRRFIRLDPPNLRLPTQPPRHLTGAPSAGKSQEELSSGGCCLGYFYVNIPDPTCGLRIE